MIELDQKVWDGLVFEFGKRLGQGRTIEQSLMCFIDDYWSILDDLSSKAMEEEIEEPLDVCIDRMMKPMWDYVYNLNREISNLKKEVALLKESNAAKQYPLPIGGPGQKYPNNIPPTHDYPLDWYKVTAQCGAMGGNVPLSSNLNDTIATTGYMQVVDPKYTEEQMKEWAGLRFNDPAERR